MMRSTDECEMSRSCHSDVLHGRESVTAEDPRKAGNLFGSNWIALVRHRRGPFLLLREKFFGFTDLGTLQVAQFNRNFFQRRADQCKRRDVVRVPVALNDL